MSEEKNERNDEELAENKNHVGGYFDSLIADFSLDELPAEESATAETEDSGEVKVETVDGITVENAVSETVSAETEPEVIFDEEAPVKEESTPAVQTDSTEDSEEDKDKKGGIIAFLFPVKGDAVGEVIRKIVFLAAVAVFAVAGVLLVKNIRDSHEATNIAATDESIIVTTVATSIGEGGEIITIPPTEEEIQQHNFSVMEYYKNINSDILGFVELPGCDIAQPVVQGTDNEYYLKHTYFNTNNQAGSIFMDYRCTVSEDYTSPSIVLYGHNQRDGTMFGNLKRYKYDLDFYAENPIVTFTTQYESAKYVIFGFFVTNTLEKQDSKGEVFHYHDYIETLSNPGTFGWYLNQVNRRNQIDSPVDVTYGDKLLVLSTCSNEYSDSRFAVFARKLREGETEDSFDFYSATINQNAKGIDWNAVLSAPTRASRPVTETSAATSVTTTVPSETTVSSTKKNAIAQGIEGIVGDYSDLFSTAPPSDPEETSSRKKRKTTAQSSESTTASETEKTTTKKKKETTAVTEEETSKVTTVPETSASDTESATETVSAENSGSDSETET